jgi:hypothetical protein
MNPQPFAGQSAAVFGRHWLSPPHTLGTPPPPQIAGEAHVGQSTTPPQPSATGPHSLPVCAQVFGWQAAPPARPPPQTLGCPPPPQICGAEQPLPSPQDTIPPQPSAIDPQFIPEGHCVIGLQNALDGEHLLGPPPPQTAGATHWPQSSVPPQPSLCWPQSTPLSRL